MKPTYRKKTSFDVFIELGDNIYNVTGTYYYAPNEIYGESPNEFTQDDSELEIKDLSLYDKHLVRIGGLLLVNEFLEFEEVVTVINKLVWEKILEDYED